MQPDNEGWIVIEDLIKNANASGKSITDPLVRDVIANSEEKRFDLSEDGLRIRAL